MRPGLGLGREREREEDLLNAAGSRVTAMTRSWEKSDGGRWCDWLLYLNDVILCLRWGGKTHGNSLCEEITMWSFWIYDVYAVRFLCVFLTLHPNELERHPNSQSSKYYKTIYILV